MKKRTKYFALPAVTAVAAALLLASCGKDPQSPGYEYFPDMYRSPGFETNGFYYTKKDSAGNRDTLMTNRLPVEGTIPRGFVPFPYPNSPAGDTLAANFWKGSLPASEAVEMEGKVLYEQMCVHCHGDEGKGDGTIVANKKFPNKPPDYTALAPFNQTDGHIYHVITYGKGNMGSHASQLNPEERWKVTRYVQRLARGNVSMADFMKKAAADTAKADSAATKAPVKPVAAK